MMTQHCFWALGARYDLLVEKHKLMSKAERVELACIRATMAHAALERPSLNDAIFDGLIRHR